MDEHTPSAPDQATTRIFLFFRFFWWEWALPVVRRRQATGHEAPPLNFSAQLILSRFAAHGALTVSQLADLLLLDISTVSRQLRTVRDLGLVTETRDPTDRRVRCFDLSTEGRALMDTLERDLTSRWDDALTHLTGRERAQLARLLEKLRTGMEAGAGA